MQEVEVKARIANPEKFIQQLKALGCVWSVPMTQDDRIFIHKDLDLNNLPPDRIILRIRQQNEVTIFTLKGHGKNELDSYEREVKVDDAAALVDILAKLEFEEKPNLHVKKTRRKTKYHDMEICLDQVDLLGSFVEVEKLVDEGDSEVIQADLFGWLEQFGISPSDQVTVGYDTLMRRHYESK